MKVCAGRGTSYLNGNSYEDCKKIAESINSKLKPKILKNGSFTWSELLVEVEHDELIYKLVLKYLRRDGFDIGNNKNPGMWMTEGTRRLMQRSGKDVIFKDLMACSNYVDGLEKAKNVSANTLLILGENDYLTPRHRAKDLINNFESVKVKEIKNSGHTMMVENPNLVLDYLSEIL